MTLLFTVILIALIFEYINGFHDTANSIATVVSTKVLTPRQAVLLAATTNLLGAMWGTAVAKTITSGLVDTKLVHMSQPICTSFVSTSPEVIVLATAVPHIAPSRFVVAASNTACRGVRTFVETTVAIELAVSWKPLMYSKISAMRMTVKSSVIACSGVFQHDVGDDISGVSATVDHFFQQLEQVL